METFQYLIPIKFSNILDNFCTSSSSTVSTGSLKKNIADKMANDKRLGDVRRLPLARYLINITSVF